MKLFLIQLFMALYPYESHAYLIVDKGVYDDDNRRLVSELDTLHDSDEVKLSRSILAQVPKWRIVSENKESISVETKSLSSGLNFCPDEKFSELPLVSSCTAFLVGPDLILTAGHCLKDKYECQKNYWVLDYDDAAGFVGPDGRATFKKENVYSCSQILSSSENVKLDYALVKLNRAITDRPIFNVRRTGKVEDTAQLVVIGHPMGLPKILANDSIIRNNSLPNTFVTNADTFSGNSGSPVINSETHIVEGILVRGDDDFKMDIDLGCNRVYKCVGRECRGETAQRTTVLPLKLIPKI
ncbi:MAG: serine protease [Alphaproteobacteria bacterium]|nr:MAG: serine protease [Alphaproteobacteria bacterium]